MSATTEKLLEEIQGVQHQIDEARTLGNCVETLALLLDRMRDLQKQLVTANEALNEGSSRVLKG